MRFMEFAGKYLMAVSLDEAELIDKITEEGSLEKDKLDAREQELARKMVSNGKLNRYKKNSKTYFLVNDGE